VEVPDLVLGAEKSAVAEDIAEVTDDALPI
jgi:hypothetical protein